MHVTAEEDFLMPLGLIMMFFYDQGDKSPLRKIDASSVIHAKQILSKTMNAQYVIRLYDENKKLISYKEPTGKGWTK